MNPTSDPSFETPEAREREEDEEDVDALTPIVDDERWLEWDED
jgi:hypothetical protein